ncbi:MAG: hypothetical protein LAO21_14540 [Acidobacteriia bacterium]|nr:hypothetical protein [Terriglobia bacterium]
MRINCLSCGHMVDLEDDYDDYEGEVKCFVCSTTLEVRTEEGRIKNVRLAKKIPLVPVEQVIEVPFVP